MYLPDVAIESGRKHNFPYSLSRWTDLPATKWDWFRERLSVGWMAGVDPLTGVPCGWSLLPQDTAGLVFWTRDSRNLVKDRHLLEPYQKVIHFTLTGWHEVERRAPSIELGLEILKATVDAFGPDRVTWRCSPIPAVPDVVDRFDCIASSAQKMGLRQVYVAFLQTNDRMAETRTPEQRAQTLKDLSSVTGLDVLLCNEDTTPVVPRLNLRRGVCEDGRRFGAHRTEGCGCALTVDPFTINETCRFDCAYCYAADSTLAPRKRTTTRRLPLVG